MKKKILVIDGELGGARLDVALQEAGYGCVHVSTVREALLAADDGCFDLAVLDAAMQEARSPDFLSMLRVKGGRPILVIAQTGSKDKLIQMLNAGADDYLTRPFELRELVERISILLQRFSNAESQGTLRHRELTLNPNTFEVTLKGREVKLTKQEFRILELMLLSPAGRVFSKQDFFDYAWGHDGFAGVDKTVNVHICNIRKKFRAVTQDAYIETIWGLGFRLV